MYSEEIWTWFHEMQKEELDFDKKRDAAILVFSPLIHMHGERDDWPLNYYTLSMSQAWDVFVDVFKLASGIPLMSVYREFTLDDIELEIDKLLRCILWWSFVEGLTEEEIGTFDYTLVDQGNGRVNPDYHFRVYYMQKCIRTSFGNLRKMMGTFVCSEVSSMTIKTSYSSEAVDEYILSQITQSIAGDADEFILYAISDIQNASIGDSHEKIAQLARFRKFEIFDFGTKLHPGQVWQMLFADVFEGKDEVFASFYENFKNESILYYLRDFAMSDFDIKVIPWYSLITNDNGLTYNQDIVHVIDIDRVKRRVKDIVNFRSQT